MDLYNVSSTLIPACGRLFSEIYTQVAALSTYSYFMFCIIGRQYINPEHNIEDYQLDMYFPMFTTLEFLFYVGWFKVGQDITRPFGEDEDDFELNYILDRNFRVSFGIVDNIRQLDLPEPEDPYRGQRNIKLPHTRASAEIKEKAPKIKVAKIARYGKEAEQYKFVTQMPPLAEFEEHTKTGEISKKWKELARRASALGEEVGLKEDEISIHSLAV